MLQIKVLCSKYICLISMLWEYNSLMKAWRLKWHRKEVQNVKLKKITETNLLMKRKMSRLVEFFCVRVDATEAFLLLACLWRQHRHIALVQNRGWTCLHKCVRSIYVCVHVPNDDVSSSSQWIIWPFTAMRPHGLHSEPPAPCQGGDPPVGGQVTLTVVCFGQPHGESCWVVCATWRA